MVIVLKDHAEKKDIKVLTEFLKERGLAVHLSKGEQKTIIGVIGDKSSLEGTAIELMPGVEKVVHIMEQYKLASKSFNPQGTKIKIKDAEIGGREFCVMAGPCAIENEEQIFTVAKCVKETGSKFLRGGAYKPRSSPYAFQGLEKEGLRLLKEAADEFGLLTVSEILSVSDIEDALPYVDIIQIGARNAQNFKLLKEVGKSGVPVLLKRGIAMTIDELLGSAEYIMSEGNYNIILCERGIRTFETATRNTLDISAVPVLKDKTHLPVIIDPSHASGKAKYVSPLAMAAVAAGADGIIVEVHNNPKVALSDASQQLNCDEFAELCKMVGKMAPIVGREFN